LDGIEHSGPDTRNTPETGLSSPGIRPTLTNFVVSDSFPVFGQVSGSFLSQETCGEAGPAKITPDQDGLFDKWIDGCVLHSAAPLVSVPLTLESHCFRGPRPKEIGVLHKLLIHQPVLFRYNLHQSFQYKLVLHLS
jgi:hypothetical protein